MTVKEKLVELLSNAHSRVTEADMVEDVTYAQQLEMEADHLIANGVTVQRWIPVTERVPENMGQYVCRYVFGGDTHFPFYQVLWYFASEENPHFQHAGEFALRVTHWMPLPEPPKEG